MAMHWEIAMVTMIPIGNGNTLRFDWNVIAGLEGNLGADRWPSLGTQSGNMQYVAEKKGTTGGPNDHNGNVDRCSATLLPMPIRESYGS